MPEGDSLHRAAARLQVLVGERVEVETPHPAAASKRIAERLDGHVLESVEAIGKNLLLRFDGGIVLRSHLRMKGRWWVVPRGAKRVGRPWLVLRGSEVEAVLWHGPVLELRDDVVRRLGPDILASPFDADTVTASIRRGDPRRPLGETMQDQRLVAGIGNMWMAEALWAAAVSPWLTLGETTDAELHAVVSSAHRLMRTGLVARAARPRHRVYRRVGRPCPRCGAPIRSRGQGDANRMAYWCAGCQRGEGLPGA